MTANEFQTLLLPLGDKLYRFTCRFINNPSDAEDALQEVFIKLWKNRHRLDYCNNIEAFAIRSIKNHCLDKLKAKRLNIVDTDPIEIADSPQQNNHARLERQEQHQEILHIINTLPEQQRIILQLRDIDGYSFEEIEEIMEINIATIRTNLCRARKSVREKLIQEQS